MRKVESLVLARRLVSYVKSAANEAVDNTATLHVVQTMPANNRRKPVTSLTQGTVGHPYRNKEAVACQRPIPVEPKPPSPRSDGGNSATSFHFTAMTGTTTSCAMRSPA